MSGIYFHIPFCHKKCNYCDFFTVSNSLNIDKLVNSEIKELIIRKNYLNDSIVDTIYFGGGTPSILDSKQLDKILKTVHSNFQINPKAEITLEANPEDLNEIYLESLLKSGINRLSIGVQSFNDDVLEFLNRGHKSKDIKKNIDAAKEIGFCNISVDLIFGIPGFSYDSYFDSLKSLVELNIQHISAYGLSIVENTLFYKWLKSKYVREIDEDEFVKQFEQTMDFLNICGFEQYEISNYCKKGFESMHNSNYWNNSPYLGIGPSAHSYNLDSRQWNVSNLIKYITLIDQSKGFFEKEYLTNNDKFNEYILTNIRTIRGINLEFIKKYFFIDIKKQLFALENDGYLKRINDQFILTRKGIVLSNFVIEKLYSDGN